MKKLIAAALLLFTNFAFAQYPDFKKGTYVSDFTHSLTTAQVDALNKRVTAIKDKTGIQLIIVVMDALPKGTNVNDADVEIDEKWKSSSVDTTNRLIYVAGIKQHGHRLKAMRGMKATLLFNVQRCSSILTAMKPSYDLKDYNAGLNLMVDSVAAVTGADTSASSSSSNYAGLLIGGGFIAVVLVVFLFMRNRKKPQVV